MQHMATKVSVTSINKEHMAWWMDCTQWERRCRSGCAWYQFDGMFVFGGRVQTLLGISTCSIPIKVSFLKGKYHNLIWEAVKLSEDLIWSCSFVNINTVTGPINQAQLNSPPDTEQRMIRLSNTLCVTETLVQTLYRSLAILVLDVQSHSPEGKNKQAARKEARVWAF